MLVKSLTKINYYAKIIKNKGFDEKCVIYLPDREMTVGASQ